MTGYDMATGLGTPVASELASGLTAIPLDVVVSGSQTYGSQTPTFTASADYAGSGTTPYGVTLNTSGVSCTQVDGSTPIGPTLPAGSDTLVTSSCGGATLSGTNGADYVIVYTSAAGDFTINPAPLTVTASSGSMNYGNTPPTITPTYSGFVNNETPSSLTTQPTCSTTATSASPVSGNPYSTSCDGAVDPDYSFSYFAGSMTVTPAALTITASSPTMASVTGPHDRADLFGLREWRHGLVAEHAGQLHDHGHELQPCLTADVPVHVLGCVRLELLVQLRTGRGDSHRRPRLRLRLGDTDLRRRPHVLGNRHPAARRPASTRPDSPAATSRR